MNDASSLAWYNLTLGQLSSHLLTLSMELREHAPRKDQPVVHLENWSIAERTVQCLVGHPAGHPRLSDGKPMVSSELYFLDDQMKYARTFSRWYRLGARLAPENMNQR